MSQTALILFVGGAGLALATLAGALGRALGAVADTGTTALRVVGGAGLFAMAGLAVFDGSWAGAVAACLAALLVSAGGLQIARQLIVDAGDGEAPGALHALSRGVDPAAEDDLRDAA